MDSSIWIFGCKDDNGGIYLNEQYFYAGKCNSDTEHLKSFSGKGGEIRDVDKQ